MINQKKFKTTLSLLFFLLIAKKKLLYFEAFFLNLSSEKKSEIRNYDNHKGLYMYPISYFINFICLQLHILITHNFLPYRQVSKIFQLFTCSKNYKFITRKNNKIAIRVDNRAAITYDC